VEHAAAGQCFERVANGDRSSLAVGFAEAEEGGGLEGVVDGGVEGVLVSPLCNLGILMGNDDLI